MNSNENIREKIVEKLRGKFKKNTNIPAANFLRVPKEVLYQCEDTVLLLYGHIRKISVINIHKLE